MQGASSLVMEAFWIALTATCSLVPLCTFTSSLCSLFGECDGHQGDAGLLWRWRWTRWLTCPARDAEMFSLGNTRCF